MTGCNLNIFEGCALFRLPKVGSEKYMSSPSIFQSWPNYI